MAKKRLRKGVFITLEGPEGCGKTTQSKLLCDFLKKEGYGVLLTREPGGTFVGEKIRDVLLNPGYKNVSKNTELMLFETARSQIVNEVILPALGKNKIVISDRFSDSTIVYQGYAGNLDIEKIKIIDKFATSDLMPDITILLDIDTKKGLERATSHKKKDRMEMRPLSFHKKVRNGYLDLAKKNPKRIKIVKVSGGIEETFQKVKEIIRKYLNVVF